MFIVSFPKMLQFFTNSQYEASASSKIMLDASMEKTLRKFTSHEEARAETYRYWQSRPSSERFEATWELSRDLYTRVLPSKRHPRSMLKDQRDLLLAFNAHNVRYLVVGGYAYSYYAEPRATKDLDVLCRFESRERSLGL